MSGNLARHETLSRQQAEKGQRRVISPPAVPWGSARLRLCITLTGDALGVIRRVDCLSQLMPGEMS